MGRSQCTYQIETWGHEGGGSMTCCQGTIGHPGPHCAKWMDSYVVWDDRPQCGAWNPERDGISHRVCLDREGHDGPHTSRKPLDLKVAWEGDARTMAHNLARDLIQATLDARTAQKLYAPTDVQQAVWAHEGKAWEKILAPASMAQWGWVRDRLRNQSDKPSLRSTVTGVEDATEIRMAAEPRSYAERKARRKKAN